VLADGWREGSHAVARARGSSRRADKAKPAKAGWGEPGCTPWCYGARRSTRARG